MLVKAPNRMLRPHVAFRGGAEGGAGQEGWGEAVDKLTAAACTPWGITKADLSQHVPVTPSKLVHGYQCLVLTHAPL